MLRVMIVNYAKMSCDWSILRFPTHPEPGGDDVHAFDVARVHGRVRKAGDIEDGGPRTLLRHELAVRAPNVALGRLCYLARDHERGSSLGDRPRKYGLLVRGQRAGALLGCLERRIRTPRTFEGIVGGVRGLQCGVL